MLSAVNTKYMSLCVVKLYGCLATEHPVCTERFMC